LPQVATIYDVAKRARVSTYTVSCVLNRSAYVSPELTARVQKAVKELDYTINEVARSLQTRKSRTVGMLIPDISNPFFSQVVRGAEQRLKKDGYSLLLGNSNNDAEQQQHYLTVFRAKQVDGLLIFMSEGTEPAFQQMVDARRAVVFVSRIPSTFEADSVSSDNVHGGRLAFRHLASRGHQHIGLVLGPAVLSPNIDRLKGWHEEAKKRKISLNEAYISHSVMSPEHGEQACKRLLALSPRPTAIFTANFPLMTGVLRAIQDSGLRCPEDVEVNSSDDADFLDVFSPAISTIVQPSYVLGEHAASLALNRMKDPDRPFEQILIKPTFKVRG
jgi:LacI family transcriptional regulator